ILAINVLTGEKRKICNIKGAATYFTTSLVWDEQNNRLFYTSDNFYRRDLEVVEIDAGKSTRLITDLRAGDLALNQADRSLWGVRHENGISTIIRLEPPYTDWMAIYAFPYGSDCYDLDISPDGRKMTAAITQIDGHQELALFDLPQLQSGDASYKQIFDFDYSSPANFVFSEDGNYLFGTSYYSGVSNVYRYDFALADMSIISNCETGFFRPVPVNADSLIVFDYVGGQGWIPGWISNRALEKVSAIENLGQRVFDKYPEVKNWGDGSPAAIPLDSLTVYQGDYHLFKNFIMTGAYPIAEGYKDYVSWGYHAAWQDAIGFLKLALTASYTPQKKLPDEEKMHLKGDLKYRNFSLRGGWNQADFYDLFGPTKTSRKGYSYGIGYTRNLIYDQPRYMEISLTADGFGDLEVLPEYQNVNAGYNELYQASIDWKYNYLQSSLGAVESEKGYKFEVKTATSLVNEEFYPYLRVGADIGVPLPLHHSSVWWRNAAGYNFADSDNSFTRFYFGGFGNNWIDRGEIKRYHDFDSFPGLDIDEAGGRSFMRSMLEKNLPPLRFRKVGVPAFYARWLRPSLFCSVLVTDVTQGEKDWYYNVGMQYDLRLITLSLMDTTLSFGAALAWDEDWRRSEELMISLKIF
ncbi:MAG TPA: hypothetical protein PLD62_04495, partial [Candidatus Cloacimonadota bacterium]|nr:hypothetical protein [Candidatus Cloacimonadota bacterium]